MAYDCWSCQSPIPPSRVWERAIDQPRSLIKSTLPGAKSKMGYGTCPTCREKFYVFYNRHGDPWVQPNIMTVVEDAFAPLARSGADLRKRAWMRARETEMEGFFSAPRARAKRQKAPSPERPAASDPYHVLGVRRGSSKREVDRAFRQKAKKCHPDRVAQMDEEFQELAHRKFRDLKAAYDTVVEDLTGSGALGHGRDGRSKEA